MPEAMKMKMFSRILHLEGQQFAITGLRKVTVCNAELFLIIMDRIMIEISNNSNNITNWKAIKEFSLTEALMNEAKISEVIIINTIYNPRDHL